MKKFVATLGVLALTAAGAANAGEPQNESKHPSKEESIGLAGGLVVGVAAGGPVGAIVGAVLGGWIGDRMDTQKTTAQTLAQRLGEADAALAAVSGKLVESETRVGALTARLSDTERKLSDSERRVALLQAPDGSTVTPALQRTLRGEVMFRTKGTTLSAENSARLMELAEVLATTPDAVVQLDGYADPRGTKTENLALSEQRAESVRAALIAGGLAPERITVRPHGETDAISTSGDMDGFALERRVVITIGTTQATVAEVTD